MTVPLERETSISFVVPEIAVTTPEALSLMETVPEVTLNQVELNAAMPLLVSVASSPATVMEPAVPVVTSIPSPPTIHRI